MDAQHLIYGEGVYKRKPMDFYPTPVNVTEVLVRFLESKEMLFPGKSVVWEPACGDGAMCEVFADHNIFFIASDIRHTDFADAHGNGGIDFLNADRPLGVDMIITNPPFNVSEAFINKCMDHEMPFALLLKSQYWHSMKRTRLFYKRRPKYVCPLTWRPSFEGKGKSSLMDFIWTIWDVAECDTKYIPLVKPK